MSQKRIYRIHPTRLSKAAKFQSLLLTHFATRWKHEYLTSLREFHHTLGNNSQNIKVGDVVLVHDESPRIRWKMAVVKELTIGRDGLIRAANIRTSNGKTNWPMVKLYPLEVNSPSEVTPDKSLQTENTLERLKISAVNTESASGDLTRENSSARPVRTSAKKARKKFAR